MDSSASANPFGAPKAAQGLNAIHAARMAALSGTARPAAAPAVAPPVVPASATAAVSSAPANPFGLSAAEGQRSKPLNSDPGAGAAARPLGSYADDGPTAPAPAINVHAWQSGPALFQPDWSLDIASDECGSIPLRGEVPVFRDVESYFRTPHGHRLAGSLSATTYQLRFTPAAALPPNLRHLPPSFFCIPVASIRKIERVVVRETSGATGFVIELTAKDVRVVQLGFRDEPMVEKMLSHLKLIAFPQKVDFLHAFADVPKGVKAPLPGWDVYQPLKDLERIGVLALRHPRTGEHLWRVSELNKDFSFSPTYPAALVFPARASDAHMQVVAGFRSKARVPALTWMHPGNKTTMWRCSQPKVGMGNNSCAQDEQLLMMIKEANVYSRDPHTPLLVADCRPRANAMANKAGGWGYESYAGTRIEFMGIDNIHAVRNAHRKLESLCLSATPNDSTWATQVAETGWLYHMRTVLSAALFVADAMHRRSQSVLVHCSDGWDRTAQVCALVQLMLDPYYRTCKGFQVLVTKEWCSFGHKFNDRAGHMMEKEDGDISPVFVQFLDATWQLIKLFPNAFEFDNRLLLLLAHHVYSCRFGTFLFNCERERAENNLQLRTPSLWAYLDSRTDLYRNRQYDPSAGDVLLPHPAAILRHVTVWSDWFLRWAPYPSMSNCIRMERYADTVYNHAQVRGAMLPAEASSGGASSAAALASSAAALHISAPAAAASASSTGGGTATASADAGASAAAQSSPADGAGSSGAAAASSEPSGTQVENTEEESVESPDFSAFLAQPDSGVQEGTPTPHPDDD